MGNAGIWGNLLEDPQNVILLSFQVMWGTFENIHSGERLKIFRGMFENIPMNVWKNSKKI